MSGAMSRSTLVSLLLALVIGVVAAAPAPAAAPKDDSGVEQLWQEYPLAQQKPDHRPSPTAAPGSSTPGSSSTPSPSSAPSTPRTTSQQPDGSSHTVLIIAGIAALLAAALLLLVWRRRRPASAPAAQVPARIGTPAWAEGPSVRGDGQPFAGTVVYAGAEMILVEDPSRGQVWVRRSDVTRSDRELTPSAAA